MKLRHIGKTTFEMKSLFRRFGLIITTEKNLKNAKVNTYFNYKDMLRIIRAIKSMLGDKDKET